MTAKSEIMALIPEFLINSIDQVRRSTIESNTRITTIQLTPEPPEETASTKEVNQPIVEKKEAESTIIAEAKKEEIVAPINCGTLRSIHCAKVRQRLGVIMAELNSLKESEKKRKDVEDQVKENYSTANAPSPPSNNEHPKDSKIESLQQMIDNKEAEILRLEEKIKFVRDEKKATIIELMKSNDQLRIHNETYKSQLIKMASLTSSSEELMKTFEENISQLKIVIGNLNAKSEKIQEEVSKAHSTLQFLSKKQEDLEAKMKSKVIEIDELIIKNKKLLEEKNQAELLILELKEGVKRENSQLQKEREKFAKQEKLLGNARNEKKKLLELYEDDAKLHLQTKELLKQVIDQLKAREEKSESVVPNTIAVDQNTKIEIEKYIEIEETLKIEVQEKENEIFDLREKLSSFRDETKNKIEYYLSQSQQLRDQLDDKTRKVNQLEEELSALKRPHTNFVHNSQKDLTRIIKPNGENMDDKMNSFSKNSTFSKPFETRDNYINDDEISFDFDEALQLDHSSVCAICQKSFPSSSLSEIKHGNGGVLCRLCAFKNTKLTPQKRKGDSTSTRGRKRRNLLTLQPQKSFD